jgi:predicted ferric reductase
MSINKVSMLWTERLTDVLTTSGNFLTEPVFTPVAYQTALELFCRGWKFYAVDQGRGRCYFRQKIITIPIWAMQKSIQYREWYICHEMSHAVAGIEAKHGVAFQKVLQSLCSAQAIQYELTYKAREVVRAGIALTCLLDD